MMKINSFILILILMFYAGVDIFAESNAESEYCTFAVNGNGTTTDSVTGLMWQEEDDGVTRVWEAAIMYCEDLSLAGSEDWRLPNFKELKSIVNIDAVDPTICFNASDRDEGYFPATKSANYWTSTTDVFSPVFAMVVDFYWGTVNGSFKSDKEYVRCVRGGQ